MMNLIKTQSYFGLYLRAEVSDRLQTFRSSKAICKVCSNTINMSWNAICNIWCTSEFIDPPQEGFQITIFICNPWISFAGWGSIQLVIRHSPVSSYFSAIRRLTLIFLRVSSKIILILHRHSPADSPSKISDGPSADTDCMYGVE